MKVLIDVVCPSCGHAELDVWAERGGEKPLCACGVRYDRWFRSAPSITPQGTRPERGFDRPTEQRVDTKAIALETQREIEAKWAHYGNEQVAEQAISREINHKAGIADEHGNSTPLPTPAPITFEKPAAARV